MELINRNLNMNYLNAIKFLKKKDFMLKSFYFGFKQKSYYLWSTPLSPAGRSRLLRGPFDPTPGTLMSKTYGLRLTPCPPLWGWLRLRNVKRLWVHWISLLWWRSWPLRRGCRRNGTLAGMHHLLDLTLLLSQSLDVTKIRKKNR